MNPGIIMYLTAEGPRGQCIGIGEKNEIGEGGTRCQLDFDGIYDAPRISRCAYLVARLSKAKMRCVNMSELFFIWLNEY
uniref:Uncharacterized protein n=2 Tax=Steinernema glaseri TaxID=37863 RepID=A0A1I8A9Z4_9BILA